MQSIASPLTPHSSSLTRPDSPGEGISGVHEQGGFGVDEGGAGDVGENAVGVSGIEGIGASEFASDETFLDPGLAGL